MDNKTFDRKLVSDQKLDICAFDQKLDQNLDAFDQKLELLTKDWIFVESADPSIVRQMRIEPSLEPLQRFIPRASNAAHCTCVLSSRLGPVDPSIRALSGRLIVL